MQVAYEDAQALNRQLRLESEMFREKLEVLRAEVRLLHPSIIDADGFPRFIDGALPDARVHGAKLDGASVLRACWHRSQLC
eukprot:3502437-Rhodomonas_salina.2